MKFRNSIAFLTALAALLLIGCGGNTPSTGCGACPRHESGWTWVSGANTIQQAGVYGTLEVADASNVPGARQFAVSWTGKSGNLWLFGGNGVDAIVGYLNDLWKFDGSNWTWVKGSKNGNSGGVYGIPGVPSAANTPGGRIGSATWVDTSGNLWLFGGFGAASTGTTLELNDLWKFDGSNWIWIGGSSVGNQAGAYGTAGTPSPSNVPGGRDSFVSWIDKSGNLWIFGGIGIDSEASVGFLNDLWKFDGSNWIWVSGSNIVSQSGVYGAKGTSSPSNVPGARASAASWTDKSGNLWLFGGGGFDAVGNHALLNDLWKFDGTSWAWISGSNLGDQVGLYGTKGTPAPSNIPGARASMAASTDSSGNVWLFGGTGVDSSGASGGLNDLWKFDGSNWTWVSGSNGNDQPGVYGAERTVSPSNIPGGRLGQVSWTDTSGNVWLFGGGGHDSSGASGFLNDLWEFTP